MPNNSIIEKTNAFARLLNIMDELREQCPWDKKQTIESLRHLTIEETYELGDAILQNDLKGLSEEVGDVMLHMVFYARIADEQGAFDIADSLNSLCEKLISRHPHIYGTVKVKDEEEVKRNWELLKLAEKAKNGEIKPSVLGGVPKGLPAMVKAFRMQEKAAKVGFDWDNPEGAWEKVREEIEEFQATTNPNDQEDEFGDLLFSLINAARLMKIDPETALERTNQKFKRRFEFVEQNLNKTWAETKLHEMETLWDEAKKIEKDALKSN
ncbi:MAG: hypothetical protein RL757_1593 [Bacteroidota bacterium]|jgi:XTP/dITP diphosphohydrolase